MIKAAILVRYDINEDAFKNRFRSSIRKDGETNREFAVRMMDSLTKWLKEYKMVDQVHQVVGIEQLLSSLPVEKRLWLVERKPKTSLGTRLMAVQYSHQSGPQTNRRRVFRQASG